MHKAYSPPRIYSLFQEISQGGIHPRSRALNVVGDPNCWAACCCDELDVRPFDALGEVLRRLGIRNVLDAEPTCAEIVQSLTALLGITRNDNSRIKDQQMLGLGLPLHLRLLRDVQYGEGPVDSWLAYGHPAASAWLNHYQGTHHSLADTYWIARRIFEPESLRSISSVQTRLVAIGEKEGKVGRMAHLKLSLFDWPKPAPEVEFGFVRHPSSFSYCIDEAFHAGLSNSWKYLSGIGLAHAGVAIEWQLEMKDVKNEATALLNGGSAGAAFALAAGSLLAKRRRAAG